jgi:hypothetical protein
VSLLFSVVDNVEKYQANSEMHGRNTGNKHDFYVPNSDLTSYQKGVYYAGIKLLNAVPPNIKILKHDGKAHRFCSVEEFTSGDKA